MADGSAVAMATLALTQGYAQFNTFLPSLSAVRRAEPGDDISADVRVGEIAAFVGTLGVGIIVSSLSGSPIPAYVSIVTALFLISIYESVLKSSPTGALNA